MAEPSENKIDAQFAEIIAIERLNGDPIWRQMLKQLEVQALKCFEYMEQRGIHGVTGFVTELPINKGGPVMPVFKIQRTNEQGEFDDE